MLCRRMHSNQPGKGNWYDLFCLYLMITNELQTIIEVSIESRIPAANSRLDDNQSIFLEFC